MTRQCGNTDPAKAMLELANANERLSQEIAELKTVILNLQKDNAKLEIRNDILQVRLEQSEAECAQWKSSAIKANKLCPNCYSPGWDSVTGCGVCSLSPADLT